MNVRTYARRSLRLSVATLLTAGIYGCGAQQNPVDKTLTPNAEARVADSGGASRSSTASNPVSRTSHVTVPQGTEIHMTLSSRVDSATSQVGDTVSGTTTSAVIVGDQVAIPSGSTFFGHVTGVDPATKGLKISDKGGGIVLSFTKLTTPNGSSSSMSGSLTSAASSSAKTAEIIGGSAAGGAILGKILGGHTKDAAIGAVVGGGIGTGIAAGTKGKELVIPAGAAVAVTLNQPLAMDVRS